MLLPNTCIELTALYNTNQINVGDIVWGCNGRNAMIYPHRGIVCVDKFKKPLDRLSAPTKYCIWWFIPLGKNDEPDWSCVRHCDTRDLATTEQECMTMFRTAITKQIEQTRLRFNNMLTVQTDIIASQSTHYPTKHERK